MKVGPQMSARSQQSKSKAREGTHTTAMLVSVIVLFLITEFPQGVLALISGLEPVYFSTLYLPLGDVMDIAALVNNAINFVLYCAMSRQFRQTFVELGNYSNTTTIYQKGKISLDFTEARDSEWQWHQLGRM